jgi:hypothetical protein
MVRGLSKEGLRDSFGVLCWGQRDDVPVHFFVCLLRRPHLSSRAGSYDNVCLTSSDVTSGDAGEASQAGKFKNGNTALSIGPSSWPVVVADYGSSSDHVRLKKEVEESIYFQHSSETRIR